jgi:hypothetical protein
MEIKRKYRPTSFVRELYENSIESWMKQKVCFENLIRLGISRYGFDVTDMYNTLLGQIEEYNEFKRTGRLLRGEFPIKRLRKKYRNI